MTLNHLRYFVAVVDCKSFRKAAETVHVSQPALSNCIRTLECFYDVPLLHRRRTGIYPTPAGKVLYEQALRALTALSRARREISKMDPRGTCNVRVGATRIAATTVVPPAIAAASREFPAISYTVTPVPESDSASKLDSDRMDFAFITLPESQKPAEVRATLVGRVKLGIFARSRHRILSIAEPKPTDLVSERWILPRTGQLAKAADALLGPHLPDGHRLSLVTAQSCSIAEFAEQVDALTILPVLPTTEQTGGYSLRQVQVAQFTAHLNVFLVCSGSTGAASSIQQAIGELFRRTAVHLLTEPDLRGSSSTHVPSGVGGQTPSSFEIRPNSLPLPRVQPPALPAAPRVGRVAYSRE